MIYQWKCTNTGNTCDVERAVDDCMVPPTKDEALRAGGTLSNEPRVWVRVFNSSTPFITLTDRGVFAKLPA